MGPQTGAKAGLFQERRRNPERELHGGRQRQIPNTVFASPSPEAIVSLAYRSGKIVPSVPRDLLVCLAVLRGATYEVNRAVVTNSLIEERERVGQRRCSHGRRRPGRTGVADDRQTAAAVNFDIDAENLLRLRQL